jgi:hypothetical protein
MILKKLLVLIFVIGLIYLVWPGPASINEIPELATSLKSDEPGDTTQNKNIAAYFSNNRREEVTGFYSGQFGYLNFLGFKIPPIRMNLPPEEAFTYIRDQQPSTYLEQFTYPFRDSLYVNGFEPFDEKGKEYRKGATQINIKGSYYLSKTTVRYYGSSVAVRVFLYILAWVCMILIYKLFRKALSDK